MLMIGFRLVIGLFIWREEVLIVLDMVGEKTVFDFRILKTFMIAENCINWFYVKSYKEFSSVCFQRFLYVTTHTIYS